MVSICNAVICVISLSSICIMWKYINKHMLGRINTIVMCWINHFLQRVIWKYISVYILGVVQIMLVCGSSHSSILMYCNYINVYVVVMVHKCVNTQIPWLVTNRSYQFQWQYTTLSTIFLLLVIVAPNIHLLTSKYILGLTLIWPYLLVYPYTETVPQEAMCNHLNQLRVHPSTPSHVPTHPPIVYTCTILCVVRVLCVWSSSVYFVLLLSSPAETVLMHNTCQLLTSFLNTCLSDSFGTHIYRALNSNVWRMGAVTWDPVYFGDCTICP
jgi:hypothetical protein